jgi:hypothetical protein
MANGTTNDLTADWCDESFEYALLMPRPSAVRNILAYSAGMRMQKTKVLGIFPSILN